jgi:hypothetical protein
LLLLASIFWWIVIDFAVPIAYEKKTTMTNAIEQAFTIVKSEAGQFAVFFMLYIGLGIATGFITMPFVTFVRVMTQWLP